ncbi:hypothetical protein VHEMI09249 [[Torrubiella] hemipterigena]|uniref:NB-ARC domain-containing protein n=1 Tax=[Torrubiella] hemipterigena TaxID=1531966 RepID=A0A0A1TFZ5_9HYPO|nr:hypothetical protein VHEMI09249 [[Torrubiella] hemipterigena]
MTCWKPSRPETFSQISCKSIGGTSWSAIALSLSGEVWTTYVHSTRGLACADRLMQVVPRESARLGMPGDRERIVQLNADHSAVCKFGPSQADQDNFKLVRSSIKSLYKNALESGTTNTPSDTSKNYVPSYPATSIMPVKTFVQRRQLRDKIREQLCRELDVDRQGDTKKVGVYGLGGAGKSQLALSYLQQYRGEYDATFWIQAGQATSVEQDFLRIAHQLPGGMKLEGQPSADEIILAVHSWFNRRPGKWLFVFDGADELDDMDDVHFVDIDLYIPGSARAHVIVTSRSTIARDLSTFEGVEVCELEDMQARELFYKCSGLDGLASKWAEEIGRIVRELGYLALAITLAGSYVSHKPRLTSHLYEYLDEYRKQRKRVLEMKPTKVVHHYDHSVMATWEMSYAAVGDKLPAACRLLTLLTFLNYEDIYLELFAQRSLAARFVSRSWSWLIQEGEVDLHLLEDSFAMLEKYSLLQRLQNGPKYSMHRLVHAWGYDRLVDPQNISLYCIAASKLLIGAVANTKYFRTTPQSKLRLAPHIQANFERASWLMRGVEGDRIDLVDGIEILAIFLSKIGRWYEALPLETEVLEKRRQILGDEHLDTIFARSNVACILGDQGKLKEAAAMYNEVLMKRRQILGDEHLDTILAISNVARILGYQGKLKEAAAMQNKVLEKRRQILGDEHLDTITAINDLATTLANQGKLKEATAMFNDVLEKRRQILSNEHLDTISTMHNLATTLGHQGKLEEAIMMLNEVLEKKKQILGDEHPNTLIAMSNLATALGCQGKLKEAIVMLNKVLEKQRQILGDKHPDTILAINNLAGILSEYNAL